MHQRSSFLITLVVLIVSVNVSGAWKRADSGTLAWLRAVYFLDDDHGWVGGGNGTLISTNNGGSSWVRHTAAGRSTVRDIMFRDRLNGWILCERDRFGVDGAANPSYLLRTKDGGATWLTVELAASGGRFVRIVAGPDSPLYLVGEGGEMVSLDDSMPGGKRTLLPTRFLILGGAVLGRERLVLVGGGGEVLLSNENGPEWTVAEFAETRPKTRLNSVHFINRDHGWAVGNGGRVIESRNGGKLWKPRDPKTSADLLDVHFLDPAFGFVIGDGGAIFFTRNGGESWANEQSGTRHRLERIALTSTKAYVVGFGGTILVRNVGESGKNSKSMTNISTSGTPQRKGGDRCAGSSE